jgi:hypothetical protein
MMRNSDSSMMQHNPIIMVCQQCMGYTAAGARCRRKAACIAYNGSTYCVSHVKQGGQARVPRAKVPAARTRKQTLTLTEIKRSMPATYKNWEGDDMPELNDLRQIFGPRLQIFTKTLARRLKKNIPVIWGQNWWRLLDERASIHERSRVIERLNFLGESEFPEEGCRFELKGERYEWVAYYAGDDETLVTASGADAMYVFV